MDIAILSAGLPHAERTLEFRSLGGSETAALMVAKGLAKRGHNVTMYVPLPPEGSPDFVAPDHIGADNVRYRPFQLYAQGVTAEPLDLLIVSRDPSALGLPHQARKCVLWLHDLATIGFNEHFQSSNWNVDEIWTVSEFHRRQVAEVTGYPLTHIKALRNGIIELPEPEFPVERDPQLLYYGSRPERGLAYLVAPGGVMSKLPDYRLEFSMYGSPNGMLPEHVRALYEQIFTWAKALPNVKFLGELTQPQVRDKLRECAALVYPSDYEETSCILAREAISVQCPIIACKVGALPETVRDCGALMPPARDYPSAEEFMDDFARHVANTLASPSALDEMAVAAWMRTDLGWDQVAGMMEQLGSQTKQRPILSRAMALVEIGDVIPAKALLSRHFDELTPRAHAYLAQLRERYDPLIFGDTADIYAERYKGEPPTFGGLDGRPRFEAMCEFIAGQKLEIGDVVIDFGCAEGNQVIELAKRFPQISFVGFDRSPILYCQATEVPANARFTSDFADTFKDGCAVLLLTEILEHVAEPWQMIDDLEALLKPGTKVLTTTPIGPWEAIRLFSNARDYGFPEHIWHLDKPAMEHLCGKKRDFTMTFLPHQMCQNTMLLLANLMCTWTVDKRRKTRVLNALRKAETSIPRLEFAAVAAIAMNDEADILRMLKSCARQGIRHYMIGIGPSTDGTPNMVAHFKATHPWCEVQAIALPKIEAGVFGFDDARNAVYDTVKEDFDWVLWIDSDEELIGQSRMFLRNNHYDSYAIHQHHLSCDPRGAPAQIDRPSRFLRPDRGFAFTGKIHEHAELGMNKGPGHAMVLPQADIMHIGYKNEATRLGRFWRNLPFLKWDRHVNPDRNLGKFLWLRDLVHQMRYAAAEGRRDEATQFALEAIAFYNAGWQDMLHFGNGMVQGFQYASEARKLLGRGIEIAQQLKLGNGATFTLVGVIEEPEELTRLVEHALKDECNRAKSRYR